MREVLSTQTAISLLLVLALGNEDKTFACEVYPSEYAYQKDTVSRSERNSANCRRYPSGFDRKALNAVTENYIHCNGTQLRLTDSDIGSEQYSTDDYYVWQAMSSASQLLFIFPIRVNLTTITLHYYSDNYRGLPRLTFYAVPDDFEVWDAPSASYDHVVAAVVQPDGIPAGHRIVSINFNFITKKVLLHKNSNSFAFALSETVFCTSTAHTTTPDFVTEAINTSNEPDTANSITTTSRRWLQTTLYRGANDRTSDTETVESTTRHLLTEANAKTGLIYTITGITIAFVILLVTIIVATITFILLRRMVLRRKTDNDSRYSIHSREKAQQMQPRLELYDQIQLSPSTGQAEFISRNETAYTNNSPPHQTEYDIHPSVDKDKPKSAKLKIAALTISSQKKDKNKAEQPTYAIVNKRKQKKSDKVSENSQSQIIAVQTQDVTLEKSAVEHGHQVKQSQDDIEADTKLAPETDESLQNLYSVVKKKPKQRPVEDDNPPPIPKYTVEELYTAVKKVPKTNIGGDKEAAPQIPSHTIDELYTAVQKRPKASDSKDEEEAPPIPAHTAEQLYSAVIKKSKVTTEDEEKIPQVPPHIMEEL